TKPTPAPNSGEDPHMWLDRQITRQRELHPQQIALLIQLTAQHPHLHPHALLLRHAPGSRMRAFQRGLRAARQYLHREGHLQVPLAHREDLDGDPVRLGLWISKSREQTALLTRAQIDALTALGIDPDPLFRNPTPNPAHGDEGEPWRATPEPWVASRKPDRRDWLADLRSLV
ncbi:hypothetical protein EAO71_01030, partial [Streptomyces sp. ms191]|uniref:helicase associated domain-containing protein n=1 Tax=Streptomyces sp. ms191 TaxID=1827978 RepID=UPI00131073D8